MIPLMSKQHGAQSKPATPAFVAACERRRRASELRPRVHVTVSQRFDTAGRPLSTWHVAMMGYPSRAHATVSVKVSDAPTAAAAARLAVERKQYATLMRGAEKAAALLAAERTAS